VSVVDATSIDIAGIGILALENLTQVEVEIRNTRFIRLSADHSFLKVYSKNATANTLRLSHIEFIDCTEGVNGARVVISAFLLSTSASFQNNYVTPVNINYEANRRNIFVQLKGFMLNCSSGYVGSSDGLECEGRLLCLKTLTHTILDRDACALDQAACGINEVCVDSPAPSTTWTCACSDGFARDEDRLCTG
jgi:hypothetical protein